MRRRAKAPRSRAGGGSPRFRFFGGKGGVGKTTCAAAAAVVAAEEGRRVLVVSTDPAHSLGDALATRLGAGPARVPTRRGRLDAAELDADRALARWLAGRRAALRVIAERGTYLDDEDIERLLRLSLPGVDELIGLIELARLARAGRYEAVVVDTAPTGHTLRLLAMPATVRRIASVLDHMYAKHRFLAERLGGAYRADASDAVIEELDAEGRELHGLLRDRERCAFSWVLLPETLSLEEAADGIGELDRRGMPVGELLVNRVTPPPSRPCAVCGLRRRAEQAVIAAAHRRFAGRPIRCVPRVDREPRGVAGLRRIGTPLAAPRPGAGAERPAAPMSAPREADLAWLDVVAPAGTRLLLFTGKGGVGKTTCAAAAALALAATAPPPPLLLLSTDPAHSLGDVLAAPVGDEARAVPGAPPRLQARELDAERAFRARRARYQAAVAQLFDVARPGAGFDVSFDRTVVEELIELAPPGVDELFAVLSVSEALLGADGRAPAYDVVVVDTAPTGHALRLLELPAVALEWVRTLLAILLKYREVMRPGALAEDLVELSRDLRRLERLLHDRRETRVVVVSRTGEVVRRETERLLARLERLGLGVSALLVNALTPDAVPGCARCARARAEERREITALRGTGRRRRVPLLLTPAVAPPPRGVAALGRWARTWCRV